MTGEDRRNILIIDNDPVLSERLRAVLANYQFKVQLFADGNDLLSGPQLFPELILLSIDPKRLGWALCNRIKKTARERSKAVSIRIRQLKDCKAHLDAAKGNENDQKFEDLAEQERLRREREAYDKQRNGGGDKA